jgi:hypothetical protein
VHGFYGTFSAELLLWASFYPKPPCAFRSSAMENVAEASEGTAISNGKKRSPHS